jgi:hypothetical protein
MRRSLIPALILGLAGVIFLVSPGVGGADPDLADVGAHSHWLVQGTGASQVFLAKVGPNFCEDSSLQEAFNQFHNNVHRAELDSIGGAAPGLHNGKGTEIVSRGCTFVPPS